MALEKEGEACERMATTTTTALEQETLKASIFQRLHPRVYFERFVSENVRPDGREFDAWRDVSVNVGTSVLPRKEIARLTLFY